MNYAKMLFSSVLLSMALNTAPAHAETLCVGENQSTVLSSWGVNQVAVANPEVADVVVLQNNTMLVVGKKSGSTTLHVWRNRELESYEVVVNGNDEQTSGMVQTMLGYDDVKVTVAGGKILLEGFVPNQYARTRAEKIASTYGEVINLLEMSQPHQVRVQSRVIEISTDKVKNLGMSFGNITETEDDSTPVLGNEGSFGMGQSHVNTIDNGLFGWFGTYADVNAQLNALVKNGDAKILSEPYIITLSGEKAQILIGGEIPIPVNTDDNTVTVEWREYGIKLGIEPTVQNDSAVDSKISTEVSSIDWASAVNASGSNGLRIPGLKSRKADTHVQMRPGMTMAIGGLISSEESKSVSKIPLLGDIPILGQFFRNTSKTRERKEIIILLTPMIVNSDYQPVMSAEADRLSKLKPEEVLRGDLYAKQQEQKQ